MHEVTMEQRTAQGWHRVVSIDPFTARYQVSRPGREGWGVWKSVTFEGEMACIDAERRCMDEILKEVYSR